MLTIGRNGPAAHGRVFPHGQGEQAGCDEDRERDEDRDFDFSTHLSPAVVP